MNMLSPLRDKVLGFSRHFQNFPRPTEHLPSHKKWDQLFGDLPKVDVTPHEKVFVAPIGIAQRVRVVLENIDLPGQSFLAEPFLSRR